MSNSKARKSCVVPKCVNTTTNAPEKLFIKVPPDPQMREKWIKAMKRVDPFGAKSCVYCCEDHFDIENDMENYFKYKLVGGRIILKKKVIPHKFQCQQQKDVKPEGFTIEKRNRKLMKLLVEDTISSTANTHNEVFVGCGKVGDVIKESLGPGNIGKLKTHKSVQVQLKNKVAHKATMTEQKYFMKGKKSKLNKKLSLKKTLKVRGFTDSSSIMFTNEMYDLEQNSKSLESDETECENVIIRNHLQKATILCTYRDPQLVLGLP